MAKVAKKVLVWQEEAGEGMVYTDNYGLTRIEVMIDEVVPDTVPVEVQQDWEKREWVYEDPSKERLEKSLGPPRMSMPLSAIQRVDAARAAEAAPVQSRPIKTVPPRPTPKGE